MSLKVSIIIPIYNVEKYIEKCIESVVNQSYKNLEILLIDDGTKDNSIMKCEKFLVDNRIKLLKKENGGLSSARNYGLCNASGDYIMFVDSDDWLEYDCVEKCINSTDNGKYDIIMFPYLREYNNVSLPRYTFREKIEFNNKKDVINNIIRKLIGPIENELNRPEMMESNNTAWAKLYKKRIVENLKFIDLKLIATEDLVFNIQAFSKAENAKFIDTTFYHYNKINMNSITNKESYNLINRWKFLFESIENEIKINHYDNIDFQIALNNRKIINLLTINMKVFMMNCSLQKKRQILKMILNDEIFINAFKLFKFDYLNLKWKLYYIFCKYKCTYFILIMLYFADKYRKKT